VGDADVLAGHHQIGDVDGIGAAERDFVRLLVPDVPLPVLETEIVALIARVVQAERPVVEHDGIGKRGMVSDVGFGADVVAPVPPVFALGGNECHPIEFEVGVDLGGLGLDFLDVRERSVDGAQEVVVNALRLGVRIEPLTLLPEVGQRVRHPAADAGVGNHVRSGDRPHAVFDARLAELATEIRIKSCATSNAHGTSGNGAGESANRVRKKTVFP
jgi:hypothetical protein